MSEQNPPQDSIETASATMLRLITSFILPRALYVAVELGIPDLLKDRAKSAGELAEATSTHSPSLYRVLRVLVSGGVLSVDNQGQFALTPLGATLRRDVPDSLRAWVLLSLGE